MRNRPKKLTRRQKILLSRNGYDPELYLLISETDGILLLYRKSDGCTVEAKI